MRSGTVAVLLGVLALCSLRELPAWAWALGLVPAAVLLAWRGGRPGRLLACVLGGLLWAWWRAEGLLATELPAELEGETAVVVGVVRGLPKLGEGEARFELEPESLGLGRRSFSPLPRVSLAWLRGAPELWPGERWQFAVRLKRPSGQANPGGFDYERWLFQRGLRATGHVVPGYFSHRLEGPRGSWLARARAALRARIEAEVGGEPRAGMVAALAMGADDLITPGEWRVLNRTGTTHLISISGLHITLVASLAFALTRWAWSLTVLGPRALAAPRVAALGSLLAAVVYAALAGFSVPTQRALIMLAVGLAALVAGRRQPVSDWLAVALLLVLVWDPFAVLGTGTWLSFGSVAGILYVCAARRGRVVRWRQGLWVHLAAALVMTPFLLWFFASNPLLSPLANLFAVPWVSFVVTPLALGGAALSLLAPALGGPLLGLAVTALQWLWPLLERLAELPGGQWVRPLPALWAVLACVLGVAVLLLPRGVPRRWLGAVWLLPVLAYPLERAPPGGFRFTLLDVGQGLAAVVETRRHVLVFDTGARFGPGLDAGRSVIAPFLRSRGWARVDRVVVSHLDLDHAGGLEGLREELTVAEVLAPAESLAALPGAGPCLSGARWTWDGVPFQLLRAGLPGRGDNDGSCVLRVGEGEGAVLLTADIEAGAERALVAQAGPALRAGVLVVPHHGSRTSSSETLIDAVRPRLALVAAGHRNRFGFPHAEVLARYQARGVEVLDTAAGGALSFDSGQSGPGPVEAWRAERARFWHRR